MGLEKLEYLLTVEETGSISKAAEILYMSQPSLSKSGKLHRLQNLSAHIHRLKAHRRRETIPALCPPSN